ncbi:MAG TPA: undecaprenyldiphospho-muramoylpentapeptide beta-N-acetylglucosaminyltransferase [Actinomycetota bacterium]|nr:undecaprenyldiphospho-muramoylpentapeptide beta-N-acetylglucosaminyltransferase [Actinomycetota bacterium]
MKAVIAAGGTAGHVNPALALARELDEVEIVFVGNRLGPEKDLSARAGYGFEPITVRGFDRARPLSLLPTGFIAVRAVAQARSVLRRLGPRVVVGMGGYVSLPVCLAARSLRIPVVVHEQNIVLGLANRACRSFARRVAVSFEDTLSVAGPRGVYVGNPVLPDLANANLDAARRAGLKRWDLVTARHTVLIFGGSQGARRINDAGLEMATLWVQRDDLQVLHICGRRDFEEYRDRLPNSGRLIYRLVDFVDEMPEAYAVADIAVARGGASSIAELTVARLPAIVVPYPHHRDRQQERHGRVLERAGAGRVVPDVDATGTRLAREIEGILGDPETLKSMAAAAGALGRPDAARRLADVVLEVAA